MRKDYRLEKRKYVIGGFFLIIVIIYIIRLFSLQVIDTRYKAFADSNAFMRKTLYPSRGMMRDRNDKLVVYNQPAYDVMIIPRDVQMFDTLDFCQTLSITKEQLEKRFADMKDRRLNPGYSAYTPQRLITHISAQDYGRLQEKLYRFPGIFIQQRILRQYTRSTAANVLGNIREVSARDIERDSYYASGDYTGDLGVEKSYEEYLRGQKGVEILIRDAYGRIKGKYDDGAHDLPPLSGKDIKLSLDIDLQEYGERLMANKIGAIVAIEPATGEILAMVSSPTYDPKKLVGRERGKNYNELMSDFYKPLFDRALKGAYPPGSTFKPSQGLILRQENIISLTTAYPCYHGFINGGLRVGCHSHGSPIALKPALQTSCNAYFCWGLKSMLDSHRSKYGSTAEAFEVWKRHLVSLGYGYRLGVDLPNESRGFIPNAAFYNKIYGEGRWSANTIISISIGQGEILATPLQIANLCATIANRGWFITPHVVKEIQDTVIPALYRDRRYPTIEREHFVDVAEGMRMAVTGGTCRLANLPGIEVCGKTGTAQNPHGKDHSAFIGFAPYNDPKIAICVYVENAGFGATYGVPIGSLMIEKYLNDSIAPDRRYLEERMLQSNTIISSGVKKH
ncbi:penicillin-binding transpeptidase domain-containing protein [Muribaculum caecicola]|uniref:Penicillin-binding protein 2 n=2 Tax=Muribaculum TaxID=1918540 RepID=A0AC61S6E0_9BACT|nr:penicillin-binding transpeptidase domain-containing protein [Muribaculum caecicola]THG53823.1 penicillin-binding protein 2 [Muribaculum caecicola]